MDFNKRPVRFRLEPLDPREVPAQLGQIVELPDAAAPAAQVALTAPSDLGRGPEASLKIDGLSLNFSKIEFASIKIDSTLTADPGQGGGASDVDGAGKVSMQDFHFVMRVNKSSPLLF
jgi:hypothetical protein